MKTISFLIAWFVRVTAFILLIITIIYVGISFLKEKESNPNIYAMMVQALWGVKVATGFGLSIIALGVSELIFLSLRRDQVLQSKSDK